MYNIFSCSSSLESDSPGVEAEEESKIIRDPEAAIDDDHVGCGCFNCKVSLISHYY